uniref:Polynucleotide adenylyltransferase n=1 Tax=Meloidogyne javanica TaxID=6303 RepID=A0A915LLK9_MELJA
MAIKNILDKERIKDLDEENNEDTKLKVERNQDLVREMIQDMKEERNENLGDEKNEILEEEKVEYLEVKNVGLEDKRELNEAIKHLIRPDDQNLLSKNQNKEKIELAQTNVNEVEITEIDNHEDKEQKTDIIVKENILQKSEREDNELVPVNEVISKESPKDFKSISKLTPFHPRMFLEEKVLFEAYEKFIGGKGDPKKIIPALEIGVIIDEIKRRLIYIKRYKQNRIDTECVIIVSIICWGLAVIITKRRWDQMKHKQQKRILFSLLSKDFVESRFIQLYKIKEKQLEMIESNKQMGKIKEMPIFEELSYFYVQKLHAANALINQINSSTSFNNNIHYDINYAVSIIRRWASFSKCYYIEFLLTGSQLLKTDISGSDVDGIVVLSKKVKDGCGINKVIQFYGNPNNDLCKPSHGNLECNDYSLYCYLCKVIFL